MLRMRSEVKATPPVVPVESLEKVIKVYIAEPNIPFNATLKIKTEELDKSHHLFFEILVEKEIKRLNLINGTFLKFTAFYIFNKE